MATETTTHFTIDRLVPPGEVLAEELEARGITRAELAKAMSRSLQSVNSILHEKKSITAEVALELERDLGIPAESWLNLESAYQLGLVRSRQA
ncbi:MAG: HigA family addiction module antidote protein [Chloroflexi bacterium]|nr:HigA family addiction module antidote protein [Chloroflexota bacterium]